MINLANKVKEKWLKQWAWTPSSPIICTIPDSPVFWKLVISWFNMNQRKLQFKPVQCSLSKHVITNFNPLPNCLLLRPSCNVWFLPVFLFLWSKLFWPQGAHISGWEPCTSLCPGMPVIAFGRNSHLSVAWFCDRRLLPLMCSSLRVKKQLVQVSH